MDWKGLVAKGAAIVGLCGVLAAPPAAKATQIGVGGALAFGDIGNDPLAGLQGGVYFGLPAVKRLSIGGDVTYYFVDYVTVLSIEPNIHFAVVRTPVLDVYPIAGLNAVYAHASAFGFSDTDIDIGLLAGVGATAKAGPLRPFAEAKLALHEDTYFALSGGLRFKF